MNEISIYGSTGFIGSEYHRLYGGHRIPRNKYLPKTDNLLYFISTVDNYNIFNNYTKDIDTNLTVLMEVLNMSRRMYPNFTFNFISSWFVYGINSSQPISESHRCNPTGFYSITKKCAEDLLISFCKTFEINYRIIRICFIPKSTIRI